VTALVDSHRVTLTFPAAVELVRLARLVASGLAAHAGLSMDDIEDLRIAVDELCALVVQHAGRDADVSLVLDAGDGAVEVEVRAPAGPDDSPFALDELSRHILDAATDEHRLARDDGWLVATLTKRREA
jgi:serine/threonine-protein kinase RsbW